MGFTHVEYISQRVIYAWIASPRQMILLIYMIRYGRENLRARRTCSIHRIFLVS